MIIKHGTLVAVAYAGGAVIFRNCGENGVVNLEVVETHDAASSCFSRQEGADMPSSTAVLRGGQLPAAGHDPNDHDERQFAARLARHIDELIAAPEHGKDKIGVVICGSSRFLGLIRGEYSPRLRCALKAEISKDLRAAPVRQIEQALSHADHDIQTTRSMPDMAHIPFGALKADQRGAGI
jgi:protein required for attachment to host cells